MPRTSKILALQREYLKTKDPERIADLYKTLTTLGSRINERERLLEDEDGVMDLAADICVKLMETGEAVITSAPSAYVRNALFYRSKPNAHQNRLSSLEEFYDLPSVERDDVASYDEYTDELMSKFDNESEAMKLAAKVIETRVPLSDIRRAIEDREFRSEFTKKMKEIRSAVKENM